MEDNRVLKLLYSLFLGVLLAIFVGVTINTFYPSPKPPEYPIELNTLGKEPTDSELAVQRVYDQKMQLHNKAMQPYNRNVSIITLLAAMLFVSIV